VSRNTPHRTIDRPLTSGDLLEYWRALDDSPSAQDAPQRPPRDGILVMARWATGIFIATIVLTIGPLLRAVGNA
jgi:hypothetical protein